MLTLQYVYFIPQPAAKRLAFHRLSSCCWLTTANLAKSRGVCRSWTRHPSCRQRSPLNRCYHVAVVAVTSLHDAQAICSVVSLASDRVEVAIVDGSCVAVASDVDAVSDLTNDCDAVNGVLVMLSAIDVAQDFVDDVRRCDFCRAPHCDLSIALLYTVVSAQCFVDAAARHSQMYCCFLPSTGSCFARASRDVSRAVEANAV